MRVLVELVDVVGMIMFGGSIMTISNKSTCNSRVDYFCALKLPGIVSITDTKSSAYL